MVFVFVLALIPPQFYQSAVHIGSGDQSSAGRFITQIAAVSDEIRHRNEWGISVRENEINAWLGMTCLEITLNFLETHCGADCPAHVSN